MTLDEAIKHCEEKAKELREQPFKEKMNIEEVADCEECAEEHEQLAEWLKELKAYRESPKGDLIDREALKKAIAESEPCCDVWRDIVDNAPAVEYPFYQEAYQTGFEEGKNARPQGKWKDHSEEGYVECPFCEHLTNCEDNIDELHYCWNCGAYMRKGGAE